MMGVNPEPTNDLEEAADLAFKAAEAYLGLCGMTMVKAIISIQTAEHPATGDVVTAMRNIDDPAEALLWLAGTMSGLAESLGFELKIVPINIG